MRTASISFPSKSHTQPETAITAISLGAGLIMLVLVAIVFNGQMTLNRQTHCVVLDAVVRIKAAGGRTV